METIRVLLIESKPFPGLKLAKAWVNRGGATQKREKFQSSVSSCVAGFVVSFGRVLHLRGKLAV